MKQEEINRIEDGLRVMGDTFKGLNVQIESLIVTLENLNESLNKLKAFKEKRKDLRFLVCRHCGSTTEVDINIAERVTCSWCTGVSEVLVHTHNDLRTREPLSVYELRPIKS